MNAGRVAALLTLLALSGCDQAADAPHAAVSDAADTGRAGAESDARDVATEAPDVAGDARDADPAGPDTAGPTAPALEPPVPPPAGFEVTRVGRGFAVYRRDGGGVATDWVTVVDLRVARVESVLGDWVGPPTSTIAQRAVLAHWDDAVRRGPSLGARARVLINGAYFSPTADPSPLTHGLQVGGAVVSYGYGLLEYPGHNALVAWSNEAGRAEVLPWNILAFERYRELVGAFTSDVPRPDNATATGRTLAGVRDLDGDGAPDALLFFASASADVAEAASGLEAFGATATAMWSGGGTSTLVLDGVEVVSPVRPMPHMVAVFEPEPSACVPACAARAICDERVRACVCAPGWAGEGCATCAGCAPEVVEVDDADAGFTTFGRGWREVRDHDGFATRAVGGGLHYTLGDPAGAGVRVGRWLTPSALTGRYRVAVHLAAPDPLDPAPPAGASPDPWVACDAVRYVLLDDGAPAGELVTIDHHQAGWVTLGDVTLSDRRGDLRIDDRATAGCTLQLDAARWTRLAAP